MTNSTEIPDGTDVLFLDLSTKFATLDYEVCFQSLTSEQIKKLVIGDKIFVQIEDENTSRYVKVGITRIEDVGTEYCFYYKGGDSEGYVMTKNAKSYLFYTVCCETELIRCIADVRSRHHQ